MQEKDGMYKYGVADKDLEMEKTAGREVASPPLGKDDSHDKEDNAENGKHKKEGDA